jgi:arsenate reductase
MRMACRTSIPVLAEPFAQEQLRGVGALEELIVSDIPEVLFVCVHNAGRSQMAAALTSVLSGGRVRAHSAGSEPAGALNPAVVAVMKELGIDLSQEFPKPITDEMVEAADIIVTMGCGDACPVYPGKRYLDWVVDDPAGQSVERVRAIRDDIRGRVVNLLHELNVPVMAR